MVLQGLIWENRVRLDVFVSTFGSFWLCIVLYTTSRQIYVHTVLRSYRHFTFLDKHVLNATMYISSSSRWTIPHSESWRSRQANLGT